MVGACGWNGLKNPLGDFTKYDFFSRDICHLWHMAWLVQISWIFRVNNPFPHTHTNLSLYQFTIFCFVFLGYVSLYHPLSPNILILCSCYSCIMAAMSHWITTFVAWIPMYKQWNPKLRPPHIKHSKQVVLWIPTNPKFAFCVMCVSGPHLVDIWSLYHPSFSSWNRSLINNPWFYLYVIHGITVMI